MGAITALVLASGVTGDEDTSQTTNYSLPGPSVSLLQAAISSAPLTGAIFTTDPSGNVVNANIYADKCDVHLNGGPGPNAPPSAAGLPDGTYYYQVTDPSGAVLLAGPFAPSGIPDTSGKTITVVGGVFTTLMQLCPYGDTPNPGGVYKVWVTRISDFDSTQGVHGFSPSRSKTDNFKVHGGGEHPPLPTLVVQKFYDANVNGQFDAGEPLLNGWKVTVTDPSLVSNVYFTPVNIDLLTTGNYAVGEVMPLGSWVHTSLLVDSSYDNAGLPSVSPKIGVFSHTTPDHEVMFGNVCLGAGGGKTLGFWSNKNGQKTMDGIPMAAALAHLASLNLRDANGADFNPTSHSNFRSWLLDANATNMAYMLSAQLAAMSLNVLSGSVSGSALVWDGNAFTSINGLMSAANASLGANGSTPSGHPERAHQEFLKNALDAANNNTNFVQSQPCPVVY